MQQITVQQLKKLHVLINQFQLNDDKTILIKQASNGRTISSKELTMMEAKLLLTHLGKYDPSDKMRKKVFALAYESGIIYGDSPADKKMNAAKLNKFLLERGAVKKELNKLTFRELIKIIGQFEQIKKHTDESNAALATKVLMSELNIESSFKQRSKSI